MNKKNEKLMADIHRILEKQNFKSEKDLRKFLDNLVGQQIPSFEADELSAKEQAVDLVYEAYELSPAKGKAKVEIALQLDPDCIEAYLYLGEMEKTAEIAMVFFEKGIAIGRRIFGGKYLKEHKGMFWGFHETRPFMQCLQQYSDCIYTIGKIEECVAILEEMIELNPNDNQGVRDQLLLYLIQLDEREKFEKYAKQYEHDDLAFSLFNRALFAFKIEGETTNSNKKLKNAIKRNKFIAPKIITNRPVSDLPEMYGIGNKDEAQNYVYFAQHIWYQTKGAVTWLKKHSKR